MNIYFQLSGLIISLIVLVFTFSHKNLGLTHEKIFIIALFVNITSLILDILSIVLITYKDSLPLVLVELECKLYLCSLVWTSIILFIYLINGNVVVKNVFKINILLVILTIIYNIIVFVLPIKIYSDENVIYTYGATNYFVYACSFLNYIASLIFLISKFKLIPPRRRLGCGMWLFIFLSCTLIQFLNSELLLVGFGSSIIILIIFVLLENPEANLENRLSCFNSYALTEYINSKFKDNKKIYLYEISIDNINILNQLDFSFNNLSKFIIKPIESANKVFAFKTTSNGLCFISEDEKEIDGVRKVINDYLYNKPEISKVLTILYLDKPELLKSAANITSFLFYAKDKYVDNKGAEIKLSEELINQFNNLSMISKEIDDAIKEDRVEVFFQPIYSNLTKRFSSAEALTRIRNKDGSLLSPGVFIPVAESTGQIIKLGEKIFEKVCKFIDRTKDDNLGLDYVEVNISIKQFEKIELADRLSIIMEKYYIDPKLINIEVTETASLNLKHIMLDNMNNLLNKGVAFSLDDFGKGESNLMYIVDMPVSIIKFDIDITRAYFENENAKRIIKSVTRMAHDMNLHVVAEGVETKEQLDAINKEKVDFIQGYFYSKPLPMDDFVLFLKENNK